MERNVIEVDETTAKKWRYVTIEERNRISRQIDQWLKVSMDSPKDDFWKFVNELRDEAKKNGLTEEELNRILNEE